MFVDRVVDDKVTAIAAQVLGACWNCPKRSDCGEVGNWQECLFQNPGRGQRVLDLGLGDFS